MRALTRFSSQFRHIQIRSITTMSKETLLIPGPIEISKKVQDALNVQSQGHTTPEFISVFQSVLQKTRKVFQANDKNGLPLVIAGSGTLGFDIAGANLTKNGDKVLVLSTGFFSDEFAECLEVAYGNKVEKLVAPLGAVVPLKQVEEKLSNENFQAVVMTHVDTSTGVLTDIEAVSKLVHKYNPDAFVIVDAVCSLGCEKIKFDDWGLDYCLSASQKAIGAPSGLSISMMSERALEYSVNKPKVIGNGSFYTSIKKWGPIMRNYEEGKASYFATPPIQLIHSLNASLTEILDYGIENRIAKHQQTSDWLKGKLTNELDLNLVPNGGPNYCAHGLTAVYVDNPSMVVSKLKLKGYVIAGGIHPAIKSEYIRIGHMGMSACDDSLEHITGVYTAIKEAIQ